MVRTALAVESIDAIVAGDEIVELIANTIDVADTCEGEVFKIVTGTKRETHRALDRITPIVQSFRLAVSRCVHSVGIDSTPTKHPIGTGAAIEGVVAIIALEIVPTALAEE